MRLLAFFLSRASGSENRQRQRGRRRLSLVSHDGSLRLPDLLLRAVPQQIPEQQAPVREERLTPLDFVDIQTDLSVCRTSVSLFQYLY